MRWVKRKGISARDLSFFLTQGKNRQTNRMLVEMRHTSSIGIVFTVDILASSALSPRTLWRIWKKIKGFIKTSGRPRGILMSHLHCWREYRSEIYLWLNSMDKVTSYDKSSSKSGLYSPLVDAVKSKAIALNLPWNKIFRSCSIWKIVKLVDILFRVPSVLRPISIVLVIWE